MGKSDHHDHYVTTHLHGSRTDLQEQLLHNAWHGKSVNREIQWDFYNGILNHEQNRVKRWKNGIFYHEQMGFNVD